MWMKLCTEACLSLRTSCNICELVWYMYTKHLMLATCLHNCEVCEHGLKLVGLSIVSRAKSSMMRRAWRNAIIIRKLVLLKVLSRRGCNARSCVMQIKHD